MAKLNCARAGERDRIVSKGLETIDEEVVSYGAFIAARTRNKTAARRELEKAMSEITRTVRCGCGHEARVPLPASAVGKQLRCRRCKATQFLRF
jgi:hypothetical protein